MEEEKAAAPTTAPEQSASEASNVDPKQLLAEGKRCLAAGDASGAVECLQEACSLLAAVHGQVSLELAEPYYLYGKALLDLSRSNSSVLGSGIPVPEDGPSSDEEGGEGEGDGQEEEEGEGEEKEAPQKADSGEPSNEEAPAESGGNEPEGEADVAKDEPVSSSSNGKSEGDAPATNEAEEEESDLQIAWEVLELARVICQKCETDEYRLKLSDVNLVLGEVGLESDQYEQAIADMNSCLQLRQFVLEPTDRRIAEAHFSLGLAYTLNKQLDEAIDAYTKSKDTLQKRQATLESQLQDTQGDDKKETLQAEIKELVDLLPEVESKINDVSEMKRLVGEKEKEGETSVGFGGSSEEKNVEGLNATPVSDITHLVRKRPAAGDGDAQPSAKKHCSNVNSEPAVKNGGEKVVVAAGGTTAVTPEQ